MRWEERGAHRESAVNEQPAPAGLGRRAAAANVSPSNTAYRARPLDQSGKTTPMVDSNLDAVLNREVIAGLLDSLRPRQRQILHLRFFEELSQAQIAEQIGTSQVHVGRLIASSLAELRSHLREDPQRAV